MIVLLLARIPARLVLELAQFAGSHHKTIKPFYAMPPVPYPYYEAGYLYATDESGCMFARVTTAEMETDYHAIRSAGINPGKVEYPPACFVNFSRKGDVLFTENSTEQGDKSNPFGCKPDRLPTLSRQWEKHLEVMPDGGEFAGRSIDYLLLEDASKLFKAAQIHPRIVFYNNGNACRLYGTNDDDLTVDILISARKVGC